MQEMQDLFDNGIVSVLTQGFKGHSNLMEVPFGTSNTTSLNLSNTIEMCILGCILVAVIWSIPSYTY